MTLDELRSELLQRIEALEKREGIVMWLAWNTSEDCFPFMAPEHWSMAQACEEAEKIYRRPMAKVHQINQFRQD